MCFIGCVNETWDYAEGEVFEEIGEKLDQRVIFELGIWNLKSFKHNITAE